MSSFMLLKYFLQVKSAINKISEKKGKNCKKQNLSGICSNVYFHGMGDRLAIQMNIDIYEYEMISVHGTDSTKLTEWKSNKIILPFHSTFHLIPGRICKSYKNNISILISKYWAQYNPFSSNMKIYYVFIVYEKRKKIERFFVYHFVNGSYRENKQKSMNWKKECETNNKNGNLTSKKKIVCLIDSAE